MFCKDLGKRNLALLTSVFFLRMGISCRSTIMHLRGLKNYIGSKNCEMFYYNEILHCSSVYLQPIGNNAISCNMTGVAGKTYPPPTLLWCGRTTSQSIPSITNNPNNPVQPKQINKGGSFEDQICL